MNDPSQIVRVAVARGLLWNRIMKRTGKKKLELQKQMVRVLVQRLDSDSLQRVVGAGSMVACPSEHCPTRDWDS